MDQSLIAQKLRELADLFERQEQVAPKTSQHKKPVPTDPAKQIELNVEPVSKIEIAVDNDVVATLDDLRQGMAELIGSGKRDKVVAILAKLNVKKVSEIDEDKFAEAMGLINGAR